MSAPVPTFHWGVYNTPQMSDERQDLPRRKKIVAPAMLRARNWSIGNPWRGLIPVPVDDVPSPRSSTTCRASMRSAPRIAPLIPRSSAAPADGTRRCRPVAERGFGRAVRRRNRTPATRIGAPAAREKIKLDDEGVKLCGFMGSTPSPLNPQFLPSLSAYLMRCDARVAWVGLVMSK